MMGKIKRRYEIVFLMVKCLMVFLITSCTYDSYEKGDGDYSLMRGDFVEAQVDARKQIVSFTTDDGDQWSLSKPYSADWIVTADTVYRCMIYYNEVEDEQGKITAEVISIGEVSCATVKSLTEFDKEFRTDPVKFESIWLSKSGKYLNLFLQLKTGVTNDTSVVQQLAFVSDTLVVNPDNTSIRHIMLHHDQNRVPEYYYTKAYVSIPTSAISADSVRLSMNTYSGQIVKTLSLRK